jgi:RNA-binding protein EWS
LLQDSANLLLSCFFLEGPPIDPDEDSDNSAIYVQGLNDNVTLDDLADFFKQCGVVKVSEV